MSLPGGLLHERRVGRGKLNVPDVGTAGQHLEVLPDRRDVTLLLQNLCNRAARSFVGQQRAGLPSQHLDNMQTEATMNQSRQHTDFGLIEYLPSELGAQSCACSQPRYPLRRPSDNCSAVGQAQEICPRRHQTCIVHRAKPFRRVDAAASHIDAWGYSEQDMAQ